MRAKFAVLLSASLLTGAIAATAIAQPLSCASVAPEVRERVREAGACQVATSGDIALKGADPTSSSAVTMTLSDGTVVRIPRDISSNINDGRKRAATNEKASQQKRAVQARASAQAKPGASGAPVPEVQKLEVPDVIGRSYVDAGSALAESKVDRIEAASAAPAGEVLAQEPSPATLVLPGSAISLQVSDASLASAADATPATAAAPPSTSSLAADSAPASAAAAGAPARDPTVPIALRDRFPIPFSADAALILGAGVLVGLLLGALLMRQWLLRRKLVAGENGALPPALCERAVEFGAGVAETEAEIEAETEAETVPEIRFAARLDPGEITIAFAPLLDDEEVAIEQSSDQHA